MHSSFWGRLFSVLSVMGILNLAVHAAEPADTRAPARVKLTVSASDSIRTSVNACLTEELRTLGNVQLANDHADWEISALALEVQSTRGYRGGIAISTVVVSRFQNENIASLFRADKMASGLAQTSNLWKRPAHYLQVDASDRLSIMCKQIVSDFYTRHFEGNQNRLRDTPTRP